MRAGLLLGHRLGQSERTLAAEGREGLRAPGCKCRPSSAASPVSAESQAKEPVEALQPLLQWWDFPGQQEYALCNLLYFEARGVYLVFCDMSCSLQEAWADLRFWLWAVARACRARKALPILLVATKWGQKALEEHALDARIEAFLEQMPQLRRQLQAGPGTCGSRWLFPVENFASEPETFMKPLRERLETLTMEILTTPEAWRAQNSEAEIVPDYVGLQSEQLPVSWLQAHDLLAELAEGVLVWVDRAQLEASLEPVRPQNLLPAGSLEASLEPARPDGRRRLGKDLLCENLLRGHRFVLAPAGSLVQLGFFTEIRCDSLSLAQVRQLLGGMRPVGLGEGEVEELLRLLHSSGLLFWFDEDGLRDMVLLNIRKVAVAMTSIISLRFLEERRLEHAEEYKQSLRDISQRMTSQVHYFQSSGVVSIEVLDELWGKDFLAGEKAVVLEVMLRKGLLLRRGLEGEYLVPSCLPLAHIPEAPADATEVRYFDLDGLISPANFAQIASELYKLVSAQNSRGRVLRAGPPQIYRNHMELLCPAGVVTVSLFPAACDELVRVAMSRERSQSEESVDMVREVEDVMRKMLRVIGFVQNMAWDEVVLTSEHLHHRLVSGRLGANPGPAEGLRVQNVEEFIARTPCLRFDCGASCTRCRMAHLLQERFCSPLSDGLLDVVHRCSLQQHTRPAGSLRFQQMAFPDDVELEEYIVIDAMDPHTAVQALMKLLQQCVEEIQRRPDLLHFGSLSAGLVPGQWDKFLKWSAQEVRAGRKRCHQGGQVTEVRLEQALLEGHRTWTAKLDVFAKVRLFHDHEISPRYFEVTNVLRLGYGPGSSEVRPVTKERDFLAAMDFCLNEYSGARPQAMKFATCR